MTKKQIQLLVAQSYNIQELEREAVETIAKTLKRADLKRYLKALKVQEKKNSVIVVLPKPPSIEDQKECQKMFPDRKIVYRLDPTLTLGVKIIKGDTLYEYSMKNTLNEIRKYISYSL